MELKDIYDENSLIEVYLESFLSSGQYIIENLGHIGDNKDLRIYYIINKNTKKYCLLTTDWAIYNDKRIKKPLTRYKKSITFFYPMEMEWATLNNETKTEIVMFLTAQRDSKIIFDNTSNIKFIQEFLENN